MGGPLRAPWIFAGVFGLIAVLAGVDLVSDIGEGASLSHWLVEGVLFGLALFGLAAMLQSLSRRAAEARTLRAESQALSAELEARDEQLAATAADAARWREEASAVLRGLGEAIAVQLERWGLTDAEKEVALLLLKGLSHKEIAGVRGTSDATTRQQARAAYKKAGLSGRNDLSAFFLEDLLLPSKVTARDSDTTG